MPCPVSRTSSPYSLTDADRDLTLVFFGYTHCPDICPMVMNSLDSTVVNVALPTLSHEFKVDSAAIEAVIVGYLVSLAVFIPASGWLGDRFGHKRILLIALAIFVTASALCGIANSLDQLILFRVMQGAGGGLLTPVGMAMDMVVTAKAALAATPPPMPTASTAAIRTLAIVVISFLLSS